MKRHDTDTPIVDRLKTCSHLRWIVPSESWQSNANRFPYGGQPARPELPIELSTSYGDWTECKTVEAPLDPNCFVLVEYATGSDYCNSSLVEVSNHRVITEECQAAGFEDGEDYIDYHGGYGTYGIAIRVSALEREDENGFIGALVETIEGLEDYPLADESLHSELEMESQNEAWESWGRREFKQELGKYFAAVIRVGAGETSEEYADTFERLACSEDLAECSENEDWISDKQANSWFWELTEYANENWVNESGSDSYIDMEKVVQHGLYRELRHWPDGETKRSALVREIRTALESAYGDWWYGTLAYEMTRGTGKGEVNGK